MTHYVRGVFSNISGSFITVTNLDPEGTIDLVFKIECKKKSLA